MLQNLPHAIGRALQGVRPGLEKIVAARPEHSRAPSSIRVTSPAFGDFGPIPQSFTADGAGNSPPIAWEDVPAEARALVLIVEDADSPTPQPLVHAIAWSIAPTTDVLEDGALTGAGDAALMGTSSNLKARWMPPDPPPGHGMHRYAFQLFALDTALKLSVHPGRRAITNAMRGHVIARGLLIGTYARS